MSNVNDNEKRLHIDADVKTGNSDNNNFKNSEQKTVEKGFLHRFLQFRIEDNVNTNSAPQNEKELESIRNQHQQKDGQTGFFQWFWQLDEKYTNQFHNVIKIIKDELTPDIDNEVIRERAKFYNLIKEEEKPKTLVLKKDTEDKEQSKDNTSLSFFKYEASFSDYNDCKTTTLSGALLAGAIAAIFLPTSLETVKRFKDLSDKKKQGVVSLISVIFTVSSWFVIHKMCIAQNNLIIQKIEEEKNLN